MSARPRPHQKLTQLDEALTDICCVLDGCYEDFESESNVCDYIDQALTAKGFVNAQVVGVCDHKPELYLSTGHVIALFDDADDQPEYWGLKEADETAVFQVAMLPDSRNARAFVEAAGKMMDAAAARHLAKYLERALDYWRFSCEWRDNTPGYYDAFKYA